MPTYNQLKSSAKRIKKKRKNKTPALEKNPQKKGICIKFYSISSKKPNSAQRKIAKIKLSNRRRILVYVPGDSVNVQEHAVVLVHGRRVPDLPAIKYHLIPGKYDFTTYATRRTSRSKYGIKLIK